MTAMETLGRDGMIKVCEEAMTLAHEIYGDKFDNLPHEAQVQFAMTLAFKAACSIEG